MACSDHTVETPCCREAQLRLYLVSYCRLPVRTTVPFYCLPRQQHGSGQDGFRVFSGKCANCFMKAFQRNSSVVVRQVVCIAVLSLPGKMRRRQCEQRAHDEIMSKGGGDQSAMSARHKASRRIG